MVTSQPFHGYYFQPHQTNRLMHRMNASNRSAAGPTVAAYPAQYRSSGSGLRGNTRQTVFESNTPPWPKPFQRGTRIPVDALSNEDAMSCLIDGLPAVEKLSYEFRRIS